MQYSYCMFDLNMKYFPCEGILVMYFLWKQDKYLWWLQVWKFPLPAANRVEEDKRPPLSLS